MYNAAKMLDKRIKMGAFLWTDSPLEAASRGHLRNCNLLKSLSYLFDFSALEVGALFQLTIMIVMKANISVSLTTKSI